MTTNISNGLIAFVPGTFIYRLRGADPDGDVLTFGVQGHGHDVIRIENLNSNEANIYLNKELDREVKTKNNLQNINLVFRLTKKIWVRKKIVFMAWRP